MKYGAILSPTNERDYKASEHIAMGVRPISHFPAVLAPVLHQGTIGSCVAHSLATMKWYQENRERKGSVRLSTDFFYHNRKPTDYQGEGMIVREAVSNLVNDGGALYAELPTNTDYPNATTKAFVDALKKEGRRFGNVKYLRCRTVEEIQEAIYQYSAVVLAIAVDASFNAFYFKNAIDSLPMQNGKIYGNHAVCGIGYDEQGIIIQNSWGEEWGYKGLARLPYGYPIEECWAVVDEVKNWDIVELKIGEKNATKNGSSIPLDVPAQIVNGRTMIPLRAVAEMLGADVEWIEKEKKVIVRKEVKQ